MGAGNGVRMGDIEILTAYPLSGLTLGPSAAGGPGCMPVLCTGFLNASQCDPSSSLTEKDRGSSPLLASPCLSFTEPPKPLRSFPTLWGLKGTEVKEDPAPLDTLPPSPFYLLAESPVFTFTQTPMNTGHTLPKTPSPYPHHQMGTRVSTSQQASSLEQQDNCCLL